MTSFINWLQNRKVFNILLVIIFYLLVVLPHEQVGLIIVGIFKGYSRDTYNLIVLIIGLIGLGLYFIPVFKAIASSKSKTLKVFYLTTTLFLITLTLNTLMVVTVEIIHFVQYALVAILLFPLIRNYGETLFWATTLGALDEAYQYFYLAPQRTDYYDFNDVIINLLGGALGLILIRCFDIGLENEKKKIHWIRPLVGLGVLTILIGGLMATGILGVYPSETVQHTFLLVRVPVADFWSVVHPQVTYHVVRPLEGLLITGVLLLFYSGLGRKSIKGS